ncbi:MAG: hypothetical protein EXX96DRAFT_391109 [Benjaminiella poitrasii]|nr:MAG: hypothetical protein EXX96DRAFT_391109 [Benjaminiella poitrasii]
MSHSTITATTAHTAPIKSILKQENSSHSSTPSSWFSKFNNSSNDSFTSSPRINSLFGSFRNNSNRQQHNLTADDTNTLAVTAELAPREIRRVRFPVADMTTEYVFSQEETIIVDKEARQQQQATMEPINIRTSGQLLSLYETICRNEQKPTIDSFVSTLITQPQATFLTRLDLTNQPMDRHNITPLADIMSIDFGIRELILNKCRLEDDAIKILMHSLLENDKIKLLGLANNPKLTSTAFKYIGVYIKGNLVITFGKSESFLYSAG